MAVFGTRLYFSTAIVATRYYGCHIYVHISVIEQAKSGPIERGTNIFCALRV